MSQNSGKTGADNAIVTVSPQTRSTTYIMGTSGTAGADAVVSGGDICSMKRQGQAVHLTVENDHDLAVITEALSDGRPARLEIRTYADNTTVENGYNHHNKMGGMTKWGGIVPSGLVEQYEQDVSVLPEIIGESMKALGVKCHDKAGKPTQPLLTYNDIVSIVKNAAGKGTP